MRSVKIGLIGLGTIGCGVYDAVIENGGLIRERTGGISLEIKSVCDKDKSALDRIKPGEKNVYKTTSWEDLVNDKEIDIIIELIGGLQPAKDIILGAVKNKKHVVTANKALLSEHGMEIFKSAADNGVFVNFEASVGGAIPIIKTLRQSFIANRINLIYGILNGTTNFILTEMSEKACPFEDALRIAQEKGIAEKDPELDISGKDSAHKLAILTLLGFGQYVKGDKIYTEGISKIGPQDIKNAARWGYSIKLLAIAKDGEEGLELRVHPTLIKSSHLLSDVKGSDNAIFINGDLVGESLLFGKGAGRKPTSSSVIGDVVEIAQYMAFAGKNNPISNIVGGCSGEKKIRRIEDIDLSYYIRFSVTDKPGVLASIS